MDFTFEDKIEWIYRRIRESTNPINSIVPDPTYPSVSEEDRVVFDSTECLLSSSKLIVIPPMRFDEKDGIYQFRDIYFSRLVLPGDDGPPNYKRFDAQSLEKLSEDEAIAKKRDWLIEGNLLGEMLSENPSEEKISNLQKQLGDGYESPYTLVPPPSGDENS